MTKITDLNIDSALYSDSFDDIVDIVLSNNQVDRIIEAAENEGLTNIAKSALIENIVFPEDVTTIDADLLAEEEDAEDEFVRKF